jgi:hypothetical protein
VTDSGFDAFAFEGDEAVEQAHPFEIARDLIAAGKPRAALELLSQVHDAFADDPQYLLICSEAWWADGDTLRAQQALLGAARSAPKDPTPLLLLAELFEAQGERDKADRVLAKARALGAVQQETLAEAIEPSDDLIAFAEQQERRTQAGLTPRQILIGVIGLVAMGGVVLGIAAIAEPELDETLQKAPEPQPEATAEIEEPEKPKSDEAVSDSSIVLSSPAPMLVDSDRTPVAQLEEVVPTAPLVSTAPPVDEVDQPVDQPKEVKPAKRAPSKRTTRHKQAPEPSTPCHRGRLLPSCARPGPRLRARARRHRP